MANREKTSVYEWEYRDSLDQIEAQCRRLPEIRYFLDTEYDWAKGGCRPKVVILGTAIPEELVWGCGAEPYWLTGGSLGATVWSDELVPRDTDPVSRSILGLIRQPKRADFSDALFVLPMTSDSMRKMAYQLKSEGRKLCLVDIPPDPSDSRAEEKWQRQMLEMTRAVSGHTGAPVTRNSLASAVERVSRARHALTSFLNASRRRPDIVPGAARMMVQDSYYRTRDLDEWTCRVRLLAAKTAELTKRFAYTEQSRPQVLVMGSPVVFPNYKIPFLIHEVGLDLTDGVDGAFLKQYLTYGKDDLHGSCSHIIRNVASAWYGRDASSAFVRNDALYRYLAWRMEKRDVEGVVYHVLKGQIEPDFEMERFETLFARCGIPVFRLETDYQYQDIEQLRIRLEAFSEMLTQNRCKEVREAK